MAKQWALAAALSVVLSGALAATAQAETCVESQHEGSAPGPICLVETFTPSQPLTTGTIFHVRVPTEVEAVGAEGGNGTLEQAGPPGGMSTWVVTASIILSRPPLFNPANHTLELIVIARRPKVPGEPVGPNETNAEWISASFIVPAVPTVHDQQFSIRQIGKWCSRHSHRSRRRCTNSRRIIITYRYQSAISLNGFLNIGIKSGKRSQYTSRKWTTPPGSQHVRVGLGTATLKLCQPPRHCTLFVQAVLRSQDYESLFEVFPSEGHSVEVRVK